MKYSEHLGGICEECGCTEAECECNDSNKITYCEDYKGQQFALINTDNLDKKLYPKQVEFENVSKSEFNFLIEAPLEEVKDKIKKILKAHYEI